MLTFDILYLHTKFGDSCFSLSECMIAGIEIQNGLGHVTLTTRLLGAVCYS